jgi:hypothetical protein
MDVENGWNEVRNSCISLGYNRFRDKTVPQMRDKLFADRKQRFLKRYVLNKIFIFKIERYLAQLRYDASKQTGSGGIEWKPWEWVIIRICRESGTLDGMAIADSGESPRPNQFNYDEEEDTDESISTQATKSKRPKDEFRSPNMENYRPSPSSKFTPSTKGCVSMPPQSTTLRDIKNEFKSEFFSPIQNPKRRLFAKTSKHRHDHVL